MLLDEDRGPPVTVTLRVRVDDLVDLLHLARELALSALEEVVPFP